MCKSSQIACVATTMHVMCMQTMLHINENSCMVLIPLCKKVESANLSHKPLCFKKIKASTITVF